MPTDPLDPILEHAQVEGPRVERAQLESVSKAVSAVPAEEFIEAVTYAPGLSWDGHSRPAGYFEIHNRTWWIDISDPGNRRHLLAVVVAAVVIDVLQLDLSTGWVARAWPGVLAVQSVSREGTGLHIQLGRRPPAPLPRHLKDIVNPDDYAEFEAAVQNAATVLPIRGGGTVTFTGP
jgi:hypothetical protein